MDQPGCLLRTSPSLAQGSWTTTAFTPNVLGGAVTVPFNSGPRRFVRLIRP